MNRHAQIGVAMAIALAASMPALDDRLEPIPEPPSKKLRTAKQIAQFAGTEPPVIGEGTRQAKRRLAREQRRHSKGA